ncbi:MAG: homoserine dehydrogenase [Pseudomonadota bacterium]
MAIRIAVVGLGRVGGRFLEVLLDSGLPGISICAVAESGETEGLRLAQDNGIPAESVDDIVARGDQVDVIFDLTGQSQVRQVLREGMQRSGNRHTVVAPEVMAHLSWAMLTREAPPDVHGSTGY